MNILVPLEIAKLSFLEDSLAERELTISTVTILDQTLGKELFQRRVPNHAQELVTQL